MGWEKDCQKIVLWYNSHCLCHLHACSKTPTCMQLQCRPTISLQVHSVLTMFIAHRVCVLYAGVANSIHLQNKHD